MSEKQLQRARDMIQRKKYDKAREILQPLAFDNDEAKELLEKLNTIAPVTAQSQKRGGCMKWIAVFIVLSVCTCVGIIALVAISQGESDKKAQEANAGFGDVDNPIPAGQSIKFDDFDITIGEYIFPASNRVNQMNMFNEAPAAGTEYALLSITMACKKEGSEVCRGNLLNVRLVDNAGVEWGEPTFLVLEPDLDSMEAIGGNSMTGWVGFEFPTEGKTATKIKTWVSGGATLYAEMPK